MPQIPKNWQSFFSTVVLPVAVSLIISIFVQRYFRYTPPLNDGGVFAAIGEKISAGKTLYKDVWDNKAPGIFFLNALFLKCFSDPLLAIHALRFTFIFILTFSLIKLCFSDQKRRRLWIWMMLPAWQGFMIWEYFMSGSYTEFYGISAYLLSVYLLVHSFRGHKITYLSLSGAVAGMAVLIKEPFAILALVMFLYLIFLERNNFRNIVFWIAGFSVLPILFAIYLIQKHAFADWFEYLRFAFGYAGNNSNKWIALRDFFKLEYYRMPVWFFAFGVFFISQFDLKNQRTRRWFPLFIFINLIICLSFTGLGKTVYSHYFFPFLVMLFCCASDGILIIIQKIPLFRYQSIIRGFIHILVFLLLIKFQHPDFLVQTYHQTIKDKEEKADAQLKFGDKKIFVAREDLGRFYLYAQGKIEMRFPCPFYIYFHGEGMEELHSKFYNQLMRDLEREKPELIITSKAPQPDLQFNTARGPWLETHYVQSDSILTVEGDWALIWKQKR